MPTNVSEMPCPSLDVLRRYIDGGGTSDDMVLLDAHISQCTHCQQQLEQLGLPSDSMNRLIAEAAQSPPIEFPSSLQMALERLREGAVSASGRPNLSSMEYEELVQIRDYRILEPIGEGGMGHVYRAVHMRLNRPVAIKVLRQDRVNSVEAVARFSREMRVIAQLEHPHIVRALDAGEQDGLHYLVMEFLAGVDVGQLSARLGPLPVPEACQIIKLAALALQFAHDRRILHRDVKPSNILLTADGGVKILDLGLAQFAEFSCDPSLSRADQALGTLAYMAPEQLSRRDEITARADVFSLGVSLHEILTGQRPFARFGTSLMLADLSTTRPDVDVALQDLIQQMVASESHQRPASMREVIDRIEPHTQSADLLSLIREYYRWSRRGNGSDANVSSRTHALNSMHETQEVTMTSVQTAPVGAIDSKPRKSGTKSWSWAYGLGTTVLATGLGTWFAFEKLYVTPMYPAGKPLPPPILLQTGELDVSPVGDVAKQLLSDGAVRLVRKDTNDPLSLQAGSNPLEPGSYTIEFDAPEEIDALEDIQVVKGGTRKVQLTTSLSKPFQFPSIPQSVGAFASYHGTLWLDGWPKGKELPFNIRMQNIGSERGKDGANLLWLKVETRIHHTLGDFTETGFLLVDADRWKNENRMEVVDGYIRASGPAIARMVSDTRSPSKSLRRNDRSDDLVLRFDSNRDVLKDFAASVIPEQRLSLHDFITLFFGDDQMAAAAEPIRGLRAELPKMGARNAWIQSVPNSRGEVPCYVVSSRNRDDSKEQMGYFMARRKMEPFSFVRLEVNTPAVKAICVITGSGVGNVDASELAEVKGLAREIPHQTESNRYWSRANLPNESATITWHGIIAVGPKSRQTVQTTISALGTELNDNVMCRWLEIEVSSALDSGEDLYYEAARLLVDDEQYRTLGTFDIKRGWIAYGDKKTVFEFPTDREMYDLIHQRLILSDNPKFQRFGVIDVLSMLFDADFPQSPLSRLRKAMPDLRAGMSPKCTPKEISVSGGAPIPGEEWTPPEQSAIQYTIRKAAQIPFNLVDVVLEQKPLAKISLEIKNHAWLGERTVPLLLGSEELLAARRKETAETIEKARKANWRVWTWSHDGRTYKAFAEYGGTTDWSGEKSDDSNVVVLLRNRRGDEIRVPSSLLSPDDWNWARNGRTWSSVAPDRRDDQFLMVADNGDTIGIQNRVIDKTHVQPFSKLHPVDQEWIQRLRQARKIKDDPSTRPATWIHFAPYVR